MCFVAAPSHSKTMVMYVTMTKVMFSIVTAIIRIVKSLKTMVKMLTVVPFCTQFSTVTIDNTSQNATVKGLVITYTLS